MKYRKVVIMVLSSVVLAMSLMPGRSVYGADPETSSGRVLPAGSEICGTWLTAKKDSRILIYDAGDGTFSGKIIWAAPPHQSFEGTEIMRGVVYRSGTDSYDCPWLFDPKLNITARAEITLRGQDTLSARVRKGVIVVRELFSRVKE